MAITLPLPVRVAAGLLATGVERLRHLPQDLPALSVTVAGQAMRASMRVQQEIAELAGRGDELLAAVTSRPTERPEWARFDDEESDGGIVTVDGVVAPDPAADAQPVTVDGPRTPEPGTHADDPQTTAGPDGTGSRRRATAPRRGAGASRRAAGSSYRAAASRRGPRSRTSPERETASGPPDGPAAPDVNHRAADRTGAGRVAGTNAASVTTSDATEPADPADMPGYQRLRLPQLRTRLRDLDADAVARLLDHERDGRARASYLTVLGNRLSTLRAEAGEDPSA